MVITHSQIKLGLGIPLCRCEGIPVDRLNLIFLHSQTLVVCVAHAQLRLAEPLLCSKLKPFECLVISTGVIGIESHLVLSFWVSIRSLLFKAEIRGGLVVFTCLGNYKLANRHNKQ